MSEETDSLNYRRMVGSIPIPSQLERTPPNEHIMDYLSAKLHHGQSLRQICVKTRAAFGLDRGDW
jgi:hypothetical protein